MSFSANKIRFLVDFSSVSRHFGKSNLCWVEEFLLGKDKHGTARSFSATRRTAKARKPQQNRMDFSLCLAIKFFNSTVNKDCFSRLKKDCFSYRTWRE